MIFYFTSFFKKSLAILFVLGIALGMNACKKGEDDPFISLASRNSRITGKWKMIGYDEEILTTRNDGGSITTETRTKNLVDGQLISVSPYSGTTSFAFEATLTLNKEGSYEYVLNQNSNTGTWWWKDSGKSKSSVGFSHNFTGNIILRELSNKKMVWQIEAFSKEFFSDNDYQEITTTVTYTYEKL